jgi:hypothetical protein
MDPKEYAAFRQQFGTTCQQDTNKAAADLRSFLQQHADITPSQTYLLYQNLVGAYSTIRKDDTAALAILDEALSKFPPTREERFLLINAKVHVLQSAGKLDEAQSLLETEWPKAVANGQTLSLLETYVASLNRRGQDDKALQILQQLAMEQMEWLSASGPPLHLKLLIDQLVRRDDLAQAESWAKLALLLCSYDERSIETVTQWLVRVWRARYISAAKVSELTAALQKADASSPLHAVKLPALDTAVLTRHLEAASASPQRVVLLLALGRDRDAMLAARALMLDQPQSNAGVLEVCRVFKAHDLNFKRADAFLEYCKTGQGENPMTAFLQETAGK